MLTYHLDIICTYLAALACAPNAVIRLETLMSLCQDNLSMDLETNACPSASFALLYGNRCTAVYALEYSGYGAFFCLGSLLLSDHQPCKSSG